MSERKFTLGQWRQLPEEWDKPYIRIRGAVPGMRFKIANVLFPVCGDSPAFEVETTRAYARLVTAAPDMHAILCSLDLDGIDDVLRDAIKSLLAKIDGAPDA